MIRGVPKYNPVPPPDSKDGALKSREWEEGELFDSASRRTRERHYLREVTDQLRSDIHRVARNTSGDRTKAVWVTSKGSGEEIVVEHRLKRTPTSFTVLQRVGGSYALHTYSRTFADSKYMRFRSDAPKGVEWLVLPD